MTTRRRAIVTAFAVAVAFIVPSALLPAASQAAAYRYWSYWLGTDAGWNFANVGPAFRSPADGTVEGWRFSVSGVAGNDAPSFSPDFASICGDTPPVDERKRVAIVVDPGLASDAPEGEQAPGAWAMCVIAEQRATGYDVLRAATTVRAERGLICGIGGYPAGGCADVIADPSPTKPTKPSPEPAPGSATAAAPTSPAPIPTTSAPTTSAPTTSAPSESATPGEESASPRGSTPPPRQPSDAPSATASSSSAAPAPQPTYSLLTSPLSEPPSDGNSGGALVAGIAVVGIAGLGGAAILRMRRSP